MADRPRSLWRNRNFLLLWSGQLICWIGTGVSQLAFPLLTLARSGAPAQAGFVGALNQVLYFLLTLPAGVLIDRWDRRRVMLVCQAGRALSLLSMPLVFALEHPSVLQLYEKGARRRYSAAHSDIHAQVSASRRNFTELLPFFQQAVYVV